MPGDPSARKTTLGHLPCLTRGESAVAWVGLSMAGAVVLALAAAVVWLGYSQHVASRAEHQRQLRMLGDTLAPAIESQLAAGQLTAVRSTLMATAQRYDLSQCRVVVGQADVLADADVSRINADLTSAHWPKAPPPRTSGKINRDEPAVVRGGGHLIGWRYPLTVTGRGKAALVIAGDLAGGSILGFPGEAGVGLIGVLALLGIWVIYRAFRQRLRPAGMVREALLAASRGETAASALVLGGDLGPEAAAWNELVRERQQLREAAAVERAGEAIGAPIVGGGDLAGGCDAVSHGMMLVNERLRVTYANHAAGVFLKSTRETIAGQEIAEVLDHAKLLEAIRDAAAGKVRRRSVCEIDREDEAAGVLRFTVHPVRSGDQTAAMVVIEDITQQRVVEEARHQFVAKATHELRAPLTNIRLYLETALDEGENDATVRSQCLNVINQETNRLDRMVGDMLSVAEIESGSMRIENDDVRFEALLESVKADYEAQAREKQLDLQFKFPPKLPTLQGDRDKLALAVHNLVGNAVKYTPEGGRITVSVEAAAGYLTLEVADTGIGISEQDCQRIFDEFYRAKDKRIAGITGSGLGLALAREIARLHGGDITVESELEKGTTFSLRLPAREEATTAV